MPDMGTQDPINFQWFYLCLLDLIVFGYIILNIKNFKDYITGIYILAPKPTTFKIVLHNGQEFTLAFMGKAYEAKVEGKRYFLLTIGFTSHSQFL